MMGLLTRKKIEKEESNIKCFGNQKMGMWK